MMQKITHITILALLLSINVHAEEWLWHRLDNATISDAKPTVQPNVYTTYLLNDAALKSILFNLPEQGTVITLPTPDGELAKYRIWETPLMHAELAAKYPGIKNFTASSLDNPHITAKLNYTYIGFNAMIYNGSATYLIDPRSRINDGYYLCYYKKDHPRTVIHDFNCGTDDVSELGVDDNSLNIGTPKFKAVYKTNGTALRTYRLALTCTGEYAVAVAGSNPTKPNVVSAMTTTLSRVNGILERELSAKLELIANNDLLIYLDPSTDPFPTAANNVVGGATQTTNQSNTTSVIGSLNYDIGHVFCSGNGGIADFEGLCNGSTKARGATGNPNPVGDPFDVDYVVHEVGHQLGAEHTFNYSGSGCTTAEITCAYEPGSGTTIMAYAGLCSGNNIQNNSDDYFHAKSLDQMSSFITSLGPLCGSSVASNNTPPSVPDITAQYNIPHKTPFELEAPVAADSDNDILNYCWEQYDLGDFGKSLAIAQLGPLFRSFSPVASRWRTFPTLDSLKKGTNSYPGEKLPEVTRDMNFKLIVRDMFNGLGSFNISDKEVILSVTDQSGPFRLTSQNSNNDYWRKGNSYTVTWDVANTTQAPVSCSTVDIYLSYDDGETWPVVLASATPNDGSEVITVPAGQNTWGARVKVKGSGNVFFDMSDDAFRINEWPDSITDIDDLKQINIYPVPATNTLNVQIINGGLYNAQLSNSVGQTVWTGEINGNTSINVAGLSSGVYHIRFVDNATGKFKVKKVVVQ